MMQEPTRVIKRVQRPQMLDGTQTMLEEETAALSSVSLSVNAKGQVQPEIKIYHADPAEAYRQAKALYEQAKKDGLTPEVKA